MPTSDHVELEAAGRLRVPRAHHLHAGTSGGSPGGRLYAVSTERSARSVASRSCRSSTSLFGTVADGARTVADLRAIGVDEIACLIDFGVPHDEVLRSLRHLADLCRGAGPISS
jgi:hypothetical protein